MKRIFSSLILALTILSVEAQTTFFDGTLQEAFAVAQKENKYLFIDCYTDWCGWCKVADKNTFPDLEVAELLNGNFISVKVDMERGKGVELAMKYRVMGFPSYLMFAPDGTYAHKMTGYFEKPSEFVENVKIALDETKRFAYPAKLNDKVDFPKFYIQAFTNKDSDEKRANPKEGEVDKWVSNQPDLMTVEAWSVMYRFPLNESNSQKFLDNRSEFAKVFGRVEVQDKISGMASDKLAVAMKSQNESDLQLAIDFADKYMDENKEENKAFYKLKFCEGKGDWSAYAKCAQGMIDFYGLENHLSGINNYSWTIYENAENKDVLNTAIGWMKKVVELEPLYMYLDTYAALLYKAGNYDKAIIWADKAIEQGKADEENVKETEELREKIIAKKAGK